MAYIGLANIVLAKCNENNGSISYSNGMRFGRAIKASIDPKYEDIGDYGDINDDEDDEVFSYADVTLDTAEVEMEASKLAFGHAGDQNDCLENEQDCGGYVGIGLRTKETINGSVNYIAIWLYKVKLKEDGENHETAGETGKYDTVTTTGKAVPCENGNWIRKKKFKTAQGADDWLNDMAGIKKGE